MLIDKRQDIIDNNISVSGDDNLKNKVLVNDIIDNNINVKLDKELNNVDENSLYEFSGVDPISSRGGSRYIDRYAIPSNKFDRELVNASRRPELSAFYVRSCDQIRKSGFINAKGCKFPIDTALNYEYMEEFASIDEYTSVINFLKFGWPVNVNDYPKESIISENHRSATDNPEQVEVFMEKAFQTGSMIGPFYKNPFNCHIVVSPVGSVPKNDSDDRRMILDMSYPEGNSVNDLISKDTYCGEPCILRYPGVDNFVSFIKKKGRNCHMFKRDLKSAYRQLCWADPADVPLLGFIWKGNLYFDLTLCQGCRSAACCCQRSTSFFMHIFRTLNSSNIGMNYLDDFGAVEVPERSQESFSQLGKLLEECGVVESIKKANGPCTKMTLLGVQFDSKNMLLSVTEERKKGYIKIIECMDK